jgi:hypothetical protein
MELHVLTGTKQDNDLSLCFGNLIRRNLVLRDHVTASSYLYVLLPCNKNSVCSFLRNSPGHQQPCILVLAYKNVQYSLCVESSVATIFKWSCYSKYIFLLRFMSTDIFVRNMYIKKNGREILKTNSNRK